VGSAQHSAESLELKPGRAGIGSGGSRRRHGRWRLAGQVEPCEARAWARPGVACGYGQDAMYSIAAWPVAVYSIVGLKNLWNKCVRRELRYDCALHPAIPAAPPMVISP
jgi:hypothetical protein